MQIAQSLQMEPGAQNQGQGKPDVPRLLAVDTEHGFRLAVEAFFVPRGWWVDSASDTMVAAGLLLMRRYAVVLLGTDDTPAGSESGRKVIYAAVAEPPRPHVVLIGDRKTPKQLEELRAAGVTAVVERPVELEKLEAYLQSLATKVMPRS